MKKLFFFLCITLFINQVFAQTIEFSGEIQENTVWDYDTVKITGDVTILNETVLNITPGNVIEFQGYYKFTVHGCLLADAIENNKIKFTVADITGFSDTTSYAGSRDAIEFINISETNDSSILTYCIIEYGKARGGNDNDKRGGGIFIDNTSKLQLSYCEIKNNIATQYGAGIYLNNSSSPIIKNCIIYNNTSFSYGGGISTDEYSYPLIKNNIIIYNTAYKEYYSGGWLIQHGAGGGIHISTVYGAGPKIENNFICNNYSLNAAVYDSSPESQVIGNIICNNNSSGIFNGHELSHSRYINNTIYNNLGYCGIHSFASGLFIENNIIWNNSEVYEDEIQGYNMNSVNYNNIETGYLYGENISEEPIITDPTIGRGIEFDALHADWSLSDDSPCINTGNPDTINLFLPEFDIIGNIRYYGGRVDIGATENQNVALEQEELFSNSEITLYPNPCKNFMRIETNEAIIQVNIYNTKGKLVFSENYKALKTLNCKINSSSLKTGIYIAKIKTKYKSYSSKFSKI